MSRRAETRTQSRRAASKEALKQLQLMSAYDDDDSTETYEITSDDDDVRIVFVLYNVRIVIPMKQMTSMVTLL